MIIQEGKYYVDLEGKTHGPMRLSLDKFCYTESNGVFNADGTSYTGQDPDLICEDLAPTWQPIETAPKDGTRFIGARWVDAASEWVSAETYWESGMKTPRFIFNGWSRSEPPTHWVPLPPSYQVEAMQQAVQRIKDKLRADDPDSTVEAE